MQKNWQSVKYVHGPLIGGRTLSLGYCLTLPERDWRHASHAYAYALSSYATCSVKTGCGSTTARARLPVDI